MAFKLIIQGGKFSKGYDKENYNRMHEKIFE